MVGALSIGVFQQFAVQRFSIQFEGSKYSVSNTLDIVRLLLEEVFPQLAVELTTLTNVSQLQLV